MIVEINNRTKTDVDLVLIKGVVKLFCQEYKVERKEISLALVGDREIKRLNKTYRQIDRATDILSFAGEKNLLGELVIGYAQVKRQAKRFGNTTLEELILILVHGLLHLVGYDDATEKGRKEMEKLASSFISSKLKNSK